MQDLTLLERVEGVLAPERYPLLSSFMVFVIGKRGLTICMLFVKEGGYRVVL